MRPFPFRLIKSNFVRASTYLCFFHKESLSACLILSPYCCVKTPNYEDSH